MQTTEMIRKSGLWRALNGVRWPAMLGRTNRRDIFVSEADYLTEFKRRFSDAKCRWATPDTVDGMVGANTRRIIVFCRTKEMGLVRRLARAYPDVKVVSGTHDFINVAAARRADTTAQEPGADQKRDDSVLFLSTVCADAEYLFAAMAEKGWPQPQDYFPRALKYWINHGARVNPARLLDAAETSHGNESPFYCAMQTDVLQAITTLWRRDDQRVSEAIRARFSKVVLLTRRDKATQLVASQMMEATPFRSLWQVPKNRRQIDALSAAGIAACVNRLEQVNAQEATMKAIAAAHPSVLELQIEDIADQPDGCFSKLADFLELDAVPAETYPDYYEPYNRIASVRTCALTLNRELIDRLGIHLLDAQPQAVAK